MPEIEGGFAALGTAPVFDAKCIGSLICWAGSVFYVLCR
jgi:hypothetical protein